jgi:hypothetical protein
MATLRIRCDCGYQWQSRTTSGRTRCPKCDTRVYVTVAQRRKAHLGQSRAAPPAVRRAPIPVPVGVSREPAPAPAPAPAAFEPPPAPMQSVPEPGPDLFALAARALTGAVSARQGRSRPPRAPAVATARQATPIAPSKAQGAPQGQVRPVRGIDRHRQRFAYAVETSCGCVFGSNGGESPEQVACPRHGPGTVRAVVPAEYARSELLPVPS